MSTLRARCRDEITRRLVPEIKRRGFVGPDEIRGSTVAHSFERKTPKQLDRLSIQFDKHQRPRFILNAQIDPPEGWPGYERDGGTLLLGRIAPGGGIGTGGWFRADTPWWLRLFGAASTREKEAVDQAIACLDAIDEWFRSPRRTRVVSYTELKIPPKK